MQERRTAPATTILPTAVLELLPLLMDFLPPELPSHADCPVVKLKLRRRWARFRLRAEIVVIGRGYLDEPPWCHSAASIVSHLHHIPTSAPILVRLPRQNMSCILNHDRTTITNARSKTTTARSQTSRAVPRCCSCLFHDCMTCYALSVQRVFGPNILRVGW